VEEKLSGRSDVLYVAARNFGILTLSEKGQYLFSYEGILQTLAKEGVIKLGDIDPLLQLRVLKSNYRQRRPIADNPGSVIERCLVALPTGAFPKSSAAIEPLDMLLHKSNICGDGSAYRELRNLERARLSLLSLDPTGQATKKFNELKKWIENPRAYVSLAAKSAYKLITSMQFLADEIAGDQLHKPNRPEARRVG